MREKGKRITIEEEKQIAHRYQEIKSCIKVGKEFGIYPQGVLNCARKYEIQTRINKKVTYKIEKEIINLYNKYQNSNIVAKEIGISDETVLRYLHKNKIILKKEKEKIKEVIEKKKICSSCKKEKSTEDFPLQNKNKNKLGVRSQCKECSVINQKNTKLKKMYGISLEKYREMLSNQNNGCAICGSPEKIEDRRTGKIKYLAVDHDHSTGKIRSLLCIRCNLVIGFCEDNEELLLKSAEYLKKHKENY